MYFKNKRILVIGGTGTIGQHIVSDIVKDGPSLIRVFSRDEYKQFQLQNKLGSQSNLDFMLGDVRNYDRLYRAMQDIDYVLHLAAMKHVPACESNPYEAVLTNVKGTYNVINAAISQNVKKVIFTSSDKAISPTNTYGATKLTAEKLIASAEDHKGEAVTAFASVRFGNVMGSRGSVIPLFKNQILKNKKITVTDSDMTRFMMSISQASNLTIKALQKARGGEVFVLKMPVISLEDLASLVIEEICKIHHLKKEEISIEEIGLRPGEKMYEELMTCEEATMALELEDMFIISRRNIDSIEGSNSKKARYREYSSTSQSPISYRELRELIKKENLL